MDTLVLDISYTPVGTVSWEKAIVWVLERIVDVVDEYPTKQIRTVNWAVNMPSIVKFVKPIYKKKIVKFSRHNIYLRDKGRCQYCNIKCLRDDWEYEHVLPRCQGGRTCFENIVVACTSCNQKKAHRTPEQAGMRLLSKPIRPKSLPNMNTFSMNFKSGMPDSWKSFLRSSIYWDGEITED